MMDISNMMVMVISEEKDYLESFFVFLLSFPKRINQYPSLSHPDNGVDKTDNVTQTKLPINCL